MKARAETAVSRLHEATRQRYMHSGEDTVTVLKGDVRAILGALNALAKATKNATCYMHDDADALRKARARAQRAGARMV